MQIDKKDYNPQEHEISKALCVKQPYADYLTTPTWEDEDGILHADKTIEVRSRNTTFRGDVLICASAKPMLPLRESGAVIGKVEIYDTKPVEDFTEEDWKLTCIPVEQRPKKGYGWLCKNPRRVVPMPCKGQLGFFDMILPKDDITEIPRYLKVDAKGIDMAKRKYNEN